jgi:hypothetical protein
VAYQLREACEPFAVADDVTCDCEGLEEAEITEVIAQATDALVSMSGFEYRGQCLETFRPRGPSGCSCMCEAAWNCRCGDLKGFTVPSPVALNSDGDPDIVVAIDGTEFEDWVLVDGDLLVRSDGKSWPSCQDITIPDGQPGSFTVTVNHGDPPSLIARNAVVEIACLFLKRNPNSQRNLPANARSASSQGVTITMDLLEKEIANRAFMLPWTIRFLTIYAPHGRNTPYVYSPELDDGFVLHRVQ